MDSRIALSHIGARYREALEQLEKEYEKKLVESGGAMCLTGGPMFQNEPTAVAAYIKDRAWRQVKRDEISRQYNAEVQVWFDCFS